MTGEKRADFLKTADLRVNVFSDPSALVPGVQKCLTVSRGET